MRLMDRSSRKSISTFASQLFGLCQAKQDEGSMGRPSASTGTPSCIETACSPRFGTVQVGQRGTGLFTRISLHGVVQYGTYSRTFVDHQHEKHSLLRRALALT